MGGRLIHWWSFASSPWSSTLSSFVSRTTSFHAFASPCYRDKVITTVREKRQRERERCGGDECKERERERENFVVFSNELRSFLLFIFIINFFFAAMSILGLFLLFFGRKGWGASHVFFVVRERENGKGHKSSFLQILSGQVHAHPELRRVHFRTLRISYICYVTSVS